jgi:hypothetical protein
LRCPTIDSQQYLIEHLVLGTLPEWLNKWCASRAEHIQQALQTAKP